jgi:NADPH-dependent 2,4-dienoyl-CoA reductase/sulfur reductase-like enzyme
MRIIVIGGVAGGMSAATRLRRLNEKAEIIVIEKSGHVSYANCGLPYYVGGVIEEEKDLLRFMRVFAWMFESAQRFLQLILQRKLLQSKTF